VSEEVCPVASFVGASVLVLCLAGGAWAQEPAALLHPVRSSTKWGLDLIAEGCEKSASFRRLVERLRQGDVIVYVQPARQLPGVMVGATELVGMGGPYRYLRVSITIQASRKRLIALLAHELQHAHEIARAPEVIDQVSLDAYYRAKGDLSVDGYDTPAARAMGDAVYAELWNVTAPGSLVPTVKPGYTELTRRQPE
jgi:hypothetical protein